ncbi:hypothetical protein RB485 [Rhodopirellula baltica SH 1]|uniref:Uncharacterized protein n=1 Tax=Rhodopirellula baltica (strain DSM 10527 / NCIMB 13988 / SH1) TaxID=243090 RepID=Q7UYN0_RHOBA|nr:hypothetical protein RB485 [Rhodopirellula baltica SH 1]
MMDPPRKQFSSFLIVSAREFSTRFDLPLNAGGPRVRDPADWRDRF